MTCSTGFKCLGYVAKLFQGISLHFLDKEGHKRLEGESQMAHTSNLGNQAAGDPSFFLGSDGEGLKKLPVQKEPVRDSLGSPNSTPF